MPGFVGTAFRAMRMRPQTVRFRPASTHRKCHMPFYMSQITLSPEGLKAMTANPQDRTGPLGKLFEAAGGRLHHYFFAFGESDAVIISEAPDNTAYASLMLAALGGGAVSSMKTTVLMTHEEGLDAFRPAGAAAYAPPSG